MHASWGYYLLDPKPGNAIPLSVILSLSKDQPAFFHRAETRRPSDLRFLILSADRPTA
jgi:hypothetical protein